MHAFESCHERTPGQGSPDLSGVQRSPPQDSNMPSQLADFLALQSSVGNQVMNQALAIQRASRGSSPDSGLAYGHLPGSSRSSSPDSGLAYGQPSGPSSPSFNGSIGGVHFSTDRHGDRMREIFDAAGQSVYGATKAAVIAMSRAAAAEYGRDGVRVNAIAPGTTMTDMIVAWDKRDPGVIERLSSLAALGRRGRPHEIAEAAAWLLSDRASYVTGMTLGVDGGTAPWPH
ncbi:NAD(P)-dependent dehydrogenase (short-subunit alcohol dehydrogenase family) [Catenulispora sp. GP43]|uniref:SDR family NAD(P)-dependent oxidoreductase n=1 Tax=Catenulispora sp. GP43 TaxID=3156263 RepID=UPI00351416C1